jgi:hypothetical protein
MAATLLWNEQRISEIKHLLVDEGLTRRAIAERIGISKSAVIHAVQKHGLTGLSQRRDVAKEAGLQRRIGNGGVFHAHSLQTSLPARCARSLPIEDSPCTVGWEDFKPECQCHWPVNDSPFLFCGRPRLAKPRVGKQSSYCADHDKRSRAQIP